MTLHCPRLAAGAGAEARRMAGRPEAQQRDILGSIALPLHGEGERAVVGRGQMADRVLTQVEGRFHPVIGHAIGGQDRQVRPHGGKVQLGPVRGICDDAAIGDRKQPVGQTLDIMRPDPARGPFPDPLEGLRLPQPDAARAGFRHHFQGVQHRAIGSQGAMAVELPTHGRSQAGQHFAGRAAEHQCEGAGTAGEGHCFGTGRMDRGGMAPSGHRPREHRLARRRKAEQGMTAVEKPCCGKVGRTTGLGPDGAGPREGGQSGQQGAARDHAGLHPPS